VLARAASPASATAAPVPTPDKPQPSSAAARHAEEEAAEAGSESVPLTPSGCWHTPGLPSLISALMAEHGAAGGPADAWLADALAAGPPASNFEACSLPASPAATHGGPPARAASGDENAAARGKPKQRKQAQPSEPSSLTPAFDPTGTPGMPGEQRQPERPQQRLRRCEWQWPGWARQPGPGAQGHRQWQGQVSAAGRLHRRSGWRRQAQGHLLAVAGEWQSSGWLSVVIYVNAAVICLHCGSNQATHSPPPTPSTPIRPQGDRTILEGHAHVLMLPPDSAQQLMAALGWESFMRNSVDVRLLVNGAAVQQPPHTAYFGRYGKGVYRLNSLGGLLDGLVHGGCTFESARVAAGGVLEIRVCKEEQAGGSAAAAAAAAPPPAARAAAPPTAAATGAASVPVIDEEEEEEEEAQEDGNSDDDDDQWIPLVSFLHA